MIPSVMSREEVRDVDRRAIEEFGLPGVVLMENAGRGCVDWLEEIGISGKVVIAAGRGNNGGDGFVIARHLENRGHEVQVVLFGDPNELRGDALINFNVIQTAGAEIQIVTGEVGGTTLDAAFAEADWIVDALLGTGTVGSLREPFPRIIAAINQASARRLAIDLPSGLDCDSGVPVDQNAPLAVKADFTATFVAKKLGFTRKTAAEWTGKVRVVDIGVPKSMFADS